VHACTRVCTFAGGCSAFFKENEASTSQVSARQLHSCVEATTKTPDRTNPPVVQVAHPEEVVVIGEHVHAVGAHADAFHNVAAWALHREGGNW